MTTDGAKKLIMPVKPDIAVPAHVAQQLRDNGELRVERMTTWQEDGLSEKDLPRPVGWRLMIEPIEVKNVTKGGLILPDVTKQAQEYMRYVGLVVAVGEHVYRHRKYDDQEPWCGVGDWVIHGRYAGQQVDIQGDERVHSFRFVNDDEILAVTESPEKCILYAGIG